MNSRDKDNALSEALDRFETCLETPVVPGELPQWCDAARAACDDVDACLRREIEQAHPDLFRRIKAEDPELDSRIELMREEDDRLLESMSGVSASLGRLAKAAAEIEPEERRLKEHVQETADAGLQFVLAVRKQEQAITTWFMEAFDRDRGDAD